MLREEYCDQPVGRNDSDEVTVSVNDSRTTFCSPAPPGWRDGSIRRGDPELSCLGLRADVARA
jgi:hypothetical protein